MKSITGSITNWSVCDRLLGINRPEGNTQAQFNIDNHLTAPVKRQLYWGLAVPVRNRLLVECEEIRNETNT